MATIGCEKAKEDSPSSEVAQAVAAVQPTVSPEEEAKKAEQRKQVSEGLQKLATEVAAEKERWTAELVASTKKLVGESYDSPGAAISAALASPHRSPGNADRDAFRHPLQTLQFLGLTPTSRVIEMGAGGGWYTEVLAPVVAKGGSLRVGVFDADGPDDSWRTVYGTRQKEFLAKNDDLFGSVKTFQVVEPDKIELGEPGSADLVLAIREMHNWQRRGQLEGYLAAIAKVLEPGGTFGVVQHRAPEGAKVEESAEKGYLPEQWLIEKVEAAGMKLSAKSEINANPKDTKDYEKGVWTLPPNFRAGDDSKDKYQEIGESDRMTLRFTKS